MKEVKFKFEDLKVYTKALNFVDLAYKTYKSFLSMLFVQPLENVKIIFQQLLKINYEKNLSNYQK
ncbi:hypothetical protein CJ739_1345 [Mariniflexile rhizosphaerae]|nr:hypothetical protein CJ739_1345 [Mariniflexile sp. TRM1-10]PLB20545.1 MAG: hypothetical protein TRG1_527 [Flavobacteriaceae bacterium FS1-H7996/R]